MNQPPPSSASSSVSFSSSSSSSSSPFSSSTSSSSSPDSYSSRAVGHTRQRSATHACSERMDDDGTARRRPRRAIVSPALLTHPIPGSPLIEYLHRTRNKNKTPHIQIYTIRGEARGGGVEDDDTCGTPPRRASSSTPPHSRLPLNSAPLYARSFVFAFDSM